MRTIEVATIQEVIEKNIIELSENVNSKVLTKLKEASKLESGLAKNILDKIIENDELAAKNHIPLCQDTGTVIIFLEIGNEIIFDGNINDAINNSVRNAYTNGYLRKSMVSDPLDRKNTCDNTPAIIHIKFTSGDKLKIKLMLKGAGSENMGATKMLVPADGVSGIKDFVIETVKKNALKACPPIVVGIGIGGNLEKASLLAKEALFNELDSQNENEIYAQLEKILLKQINDLNIGPMGLGGNTTCLGVKIASYPCHIASLPVAINLECHASRHKIIII